jgi:hypothetical protein
MIAGRRKAGVNSDYQGRRPVMLQPGLKGPVVQYHRFSKPGKGATLCHNPPARFKIRVRHHEVG